MGLYLSGGLWEDDLMKPRSSKKRGLYGSYNVDENGPFDEAVEISNKLGCVTWADKSRHNPEKKLDFPTDIFVRLTGKESYFRGILLAIAHADALPPDFADREHNHGPSAWRKGISDFKSVLFISCLQPVSRPTELGALVPPQHPTYVP